MIYIDPWKLSSSIPADYILITHDHFDHLSLPDVTRVRKPTSIIVGPETCRFKVPGTTVIAPTDRLVFPDLTIEAVPAYNKNKNFHPRSRDRVGYIIGIDGFRIYHAGDTDHIPEMKAIQCDIALLPVSGTYVMTAEEAAAAVADIGCTAAIPMHWGDLVGSRSDAEKFKKLASCNVVIPDRIA